MDLWLAAASRSRVLLRTSASTRQRPPLRCARAAGAVTGGRHRAAPLPSRSRASRAFAAAARKSTTALASRSWAERRNHALVATATPTFTISAALVLSRTVEIRVVVAISKVPVEERRDTGGTERGVIAATLVGIGPHHPFGVLGAAQADGQMDVVQQAAFEQLGLDFARPPGGVGIRRPLPHGRWIRLFLDEEGASGLCRVLTRHVEREHVLHAPRSRGIGREPLPAAAHLVNPEEGERAPWSRQAAPRRCPRESAAASA